MRSAVAQVKRPRAWHASAARLRIDRLKASLRPVSEGRPVITIVFDVVRILLNLYWYAVVAAVIVSMLISFGVLDTRNRLVWSIADFLERVTEPALRPIRRMLPNLGPIDISPLILLILIFAVDALLLRLQVALVTGDLRGLLL